APDPAGSAGALYVASDNFDRRFDTGAVTAVELSTVAGLPPMGAPVGLDGPVQLTELGLGPHSQLAIQSLAGEVARYALPGGGSRLFIPSRAEGNDLHVINAAGAALGCYPDDPVARDSSATNCV